MTKKVTEEELNQGDPICDKCDSAKILEEGSWICPHCDGEIDFLGEDDE